MYSTYQLTLEHIHVTFEGQAKCKGLNAVFTILQYKLHSFNIQVDRSTRGLLAKPFKNFQNHLYGQPVLTFDKRQICSAICVESLNEH